jgi:hypothetical protein
VSPPLPPKREPRSQSAGLSGETIARQAEMLANRVAKAHRKLHPAFE